PSAGSERETASRGSWLLRFADGAEQIVGELLLRVVALIVEVRRHAAQGGVVALIVIDVIADAVGLSRRQRDVELPHVALLDQDKRAFLEETERTAERGRHERPREHLLVPASPGAAQIGGDLRLLFGRVDT